MLELISNW